MDANTARSLALISAVFCATTAALLIWEWRQSAQNDPLHSARADRLNALVRRHLASPHDDDIKAEIMRLDQQLRQEYFDARSRWRIGIALLFASLAIFAAAGRRAWAKMPRPGDSVIPRWRNGARLALVMGGCFLLAFPALVSLLSPPICEAESGAARRSSPALLAERTAAVAALPDDPAPWPAFRGPDGSGACAFADVPATWDEESGLNILWKTPVPKPGLSSPVRWANRIFVTGATRTEHELYCFDADHGELLWTATRRPGPGAATDYPVYEGNGDFLHAAATPVVDGKSVFALYGTGEIVAFEATTGRIKWARLLATTRGNPYGIASSPILADGLLIVLVDSDRNRIFALDPETGRERWVRERADRTWATPLLFRRPKGAQLIIAGSPTVAGWSLANGERLWYMDLLSGDAACSPISVGDEVVVCGEGNGIFAIAADGKKDDGAERLVWKVESLNKGYFAAVISPVSDGERIWLHCGEALVCFEAKTGLVLYEEELPESCIYASPVLAGGKIYAFGEKRTFVATAGPVYRLLGTCRLRETVNTCPAFAPGRMWLRGEKNLYCVGKAQTP